MAFGLAGPTTKRPLNAWQAAVQIREELPSIADLCGSGWWSALENVTQAVKSPSDRKLAQEAVVKAIPCPSCRDHGLKLLSALHDLQNWENGKPFYDEKNFKAVAREYVEARNQLLDRQGKRPHEIALPMGLRQDSDPWGSRCRDPLGRFLPTDECPDALKDRPDVQGTPLTFAIGTNGVTRYELRYRVVDVHDLIASHDPFTFVPNPRYPQELQPRLRDRAATRVQVDRIAQNLEPDSLLTDFRVLDRGAPIIGPDLVVESGNGRVMALQKATQDFPERFSSYVALLLEVAPTLGIPSSEVEGLAHPVLVRQRLTEVDRKAFAEEANTPATIGASAIEQARSDANRITPGMLDGLRIGDNQSIEDALRSPANRSFVALFLSALPETDQARLVDSDGRTNQDGVRRMTMAVFVSAFQSGTVGLQLAEMAYESIDLDIRNVVNGISRALGPLATAEAMTRVGARNSNLSIGEDLGVAAVVFRKVKNTPGLTVTKYLAQAQLFERELDAFQERILKDIDARSRSAKKIGAIIRNYAQSVIDSPPPGQTTFIDLGEVSKEELWTAAVNKADLDPTGTTPGLFGQAIPLEASQKQYEAITKAIRDALARGVAPWRKPWRASGHIPYNVVSGRPYRGLNVPLLILSGYADPRWLTLKQANEKGGRVRKGERSTLVYFWKLDLAPTGKDEDPGNPGFDEEGEPLVKRRFIFRMYNVFNVQQCEGLRLPPLQDIALKPLDPLPEAERIAQSYLARTGVPLTHDADQKAYYVPARDTLHMPLRELFEDRTGYYATLFHELGHSTGHPTRLNRKDTPGEPIVFGSPNYSREELVAEFCSAFLTSEVGLPNIEPSAAYIQSWLRVLSDDPAMLVFAASAGQKAADYIQGETTQDEPEEVGDVREPVSAGRSNAGYRVPRRLPRCSAYDVANVESCIKSLKGDTSVNAYAVCSASVGCSPRKRLEIEEMEMDGEIITIVSDEEMAEAIEDLLILG